MIKELMGAAVEQLAPTGGRELGQLSSRDDLSDAIPDFKDEAIQNRSEIAGEKEAIDKAEQLEQNRNDGANRENEALQDLQKEFPEKEGFKIEREQYLRDADGNIVKDPETGEARRIDFVVTRDGQVEKSVEVTSETAPKDAQSAKEARIRAAGGNYIKDRDTGQLVEMPKNVQTEIRRYV